PRRGREPGRPAGARPSAAPVRIRRAPRLERRRPRTAAPRLRVFRPPELLCEDLVDTCRDVRATAIASSDERQPPAVPVANVSLERFAGELRERDAATLGFVPDASIQLLADLHRRPLDVCQHTSV